MVLPCCDIAMYCVGTITGTKPVMNYNFQGAVRAVVHEDVDPGLYALDEVAAVPFHCEGNKAL